MDGEFNKAWERIQEEAADIPLMDRERSPALQWLAANEINQDEISRIGEGLTTPMSALVAVGVPLEKIVSAVFQSGVQLGWDTAMARMGSVTGDN